MSNGQVDATLFKKTMAHWASGVTVVSTLLDGMPHGMTASAFCSVSLDPPLVLVSVAHKARMHGFLGQARKYGVSILAREQEKVSQHFAGRPHEGMEDVFEMREGWPLVRGAIGQIVCDVAHAFVAGDHTIYVGAVRWMDSKEEGTPLLYFKGGYRSVAGV